jgi:poly(A) polymerase
LKELQSLEEQAKQMEGLKKYQTLCERARTVLHYDNLPRLAMQRYLGVLNTKMNEFLKLFMAGHGASTLDYLLRYQLLQYLFPETVDSLRDNSLALPLLEAAVDSTDQRIAEDKPVTPAFLLAAALWAPVCRQEKLLREQGDAPMVALHAAGQQVIARQAQVLSIPKRFSQPMREIWEFQLRLTRRKGHKAAELVDHRRFRAAYDFLLLREQAGEETGGLGDWWTSFQTLPAEERLRQAGSKDNARRRRPPRKRPAGQV